MPDVPVLAVSGDLDTNTPAASGRKAADLFARAIFVEIPNVGHTPESSPCVCCTVLEAGFNQSVRPLPEHSWKWKRDTDG